MKKMGLLTVLLLAAAVLLCGCKGGMSAEDAQSYAKSIMDASYKGEFDKYIEWTKSDRKEAMELYESNVDATMKEAGFTELGLSGDLTGDYRQLFFDMIKKAKYEVGAAKDLGEKTYAIDVRVEPFTGFEGIQEQVKTAATEELKSLPEVPEQDAVNELVFRKMYELMAQKVAEPIYGEPQTVTITVKRDSDGVYYIDRNDMAALDDALFPSSSF